MQKNREPQGLFVCCTRVSSFVLTTHLNPVFSNTHYTGYIHLNLTNSFTEHIVLYPDCHISSCLLVHTLATDWLPQGNRNLFHVNKNLTLELGLYSHSLSTSSVIESRSASTLCMVSRSMGGVFVLLWSLASNSLVFSDKSEFSKLKKMPPVQLSCPLTSEPFSSSFGISCLITQILTIVF